MLLKILTDTDVNAFPSNPTSCAESIVPPDLATITSMRFEISPCTKNCHAKGNIYLINSLLPIRPAKMCQSPQLIFLSYKNHYHSALTFNFDNKLWNCLTTSWLNIADFDTDLIYMCNFCWQYTMFMFFKELHQKSTKTQCITGVNKNVSASYYTCFWVVSTLTRHSAKVAVNVSNTKNLSIITFTLQHIQILKPI